MTLASRIEQLLADPLLAAREALARGSRAIGYVGADVPVELILAAAATPLRLRGNPREPTPNADRYLEDSFSPETRSIAEQWLTGALDVFEAVVFSRSDDSAQRLYYYLCELQRLRLCGGPTPLLFDLAGIDRERSFAHTIASTRRLATELNVQMGALADAFDRVTERASVLRRLSARRLDAQPVAGSFAHRLLRASQLDWSSDLDAALQTSMDAVGAGPKRRLALIGSAPPDERLHEAAEASGAQFIVELNETNAPLAAPAATVIDPLERAADRAYRTIRAARELLAAPDAVLERARALGVHGAVIWLITEDTGLAWEAPRIAQSFERAGIPVLTLTQQRWASDQDASIRIGEFARTLERGS